MSTNPPPGQGKAVSTDIIEASALAYLNPLNRYLDEQRRIADRERRRKP